MLSLLNQNTNENLAKAHAIVRYLTSKQGPKGGFQSTQDTVVALDALTKYSALLSSQKLDLNITMNAKDQTQITKMKENDRLKSKRMILKDANNRVTVQVEGAGCVLVQVNLEYYLKHLPASDAFKLEMEVAAVSTIDECSIAALNPCFRYNGPDVQANMAILEVGLPSGYEADRASLYKLIDVDENAKSSEYFTHGCLSSSVHGIVRKISKIWSIVVSTILEDFTHGFVSLACSLVRFVRTSSNLNRVFFTNYVSLND